MTHAEDARIVYADIIGHEHHRSETRPHMSMYDRAAQFSSFDALAGYSEMIAEEARWTETAVEPDESVLEQLGEKLAALSGKAGQGMRPLVRFTLFIPDERKAGGRYETILDRVSQIDTITQRVILESRTERSGSKRWITFSSIVEIEELSEEE